MNAPSPVVLIVDDLPRNRLLYRLLVEETGCGAVEAATGPEALALCRDHDFVMVLLDVHLGTPDGFETARMIRALPDGSCLPIVFISAVFTEDRDKYKGHESGAVDYLVTPVIPQILKAKVRVFKALWEHQQEILAHAAELARLNQCLLAMTEEMDAFSDVVAHDLRSPFRHITGFANELLHKEGGSLTAEARYLLDRILHAGAHGSQLLEDLLRLGRAAGAPISTRIEVDLSAMAEGLLETLTEKDSLPVVHTVEAGLTAPADPIQTRMLMEQLLTNAIKFSRPKGAAHIRVGRAATPFGDAFYVSDDGVGFDPALAKAHLFRPFRRLHGMEIPGTGIGLAAAKRIVTRHGGTIWAESRPHHGATFYFRLE